MIKYYAMCEVIINDLILKHLFFWTHYYCITSTTTFLNKQLRKVTLKNYNNNH